MKKIFTFFVLASFLIASHMSLVHAFDMQKMHTTRHHANNFEMSATETSIFCTSTDEQTGKTECAQEIFPTKGVLSPGYKEVKICTIDCRHGISTFVPKYFSSINISPDFFRKYRYKSKSSYTVLIWMSVKNLN